MRLSIVTTMYMSEPYVLEFYRRARAAADKITPDVEIIFVDDGSPDAALQQAVSLLDSDPCVRVIQLSRNFGHHKAMMTGPAHATGDLVFLIDSDLEEDPALLEPFYEKLISTRRRSIWLPRAAARRLVEEFRTENPLSGVRPAV